MSDDDRRAARTITVALTQQAAEAMQTAATINGDTMTDTINRALVIYAELEQARQFGCTVLLREPDGSLIKLTHDTAPVPGHE